MRWILLLFLVALLSPFLSSPKLKVSYNTTQVLFIIKLNEYYSSFSAQYPKLVSILHEAGFREVLSIFNITESLKNNFDELLKGLRERYSQKALALEDLFKQVDVYAYYIVNLIEQYWPLKVKLTEINSNKQYFLARADFLDNEASNIVKKYYNMELEVEKELGLAEFKSQYYISKSLEIKERIVSLVQHLRSVVNDIVKRLKRCEPLPNTTDPLYNEVASLVKGLCGANAREVLYNMLLASPPKYIIDKLNGFPQRVQIARLIVLMAFDPYLEGPLLTNIISITLNIKPDVAIYLVGIIRGSKESYAKFLASMTNYPKIVYESIMNDEPVSLVIRKIEKSKLMEVFRNVTFSSMIVTRYMSFGRCERSFLAALMASKEFKAPLFYTYLIFKGKSVMDILKIAVSQSIVSSDIVPWALATSKTLDEALSKALNKVYYDMMQRMIKMGLSERAALLAYYLMSSEGPGLTDQQIANITVQVLTAEIEELERSNELVKFITTIIPPKDITLYILGNGELDVNVLVNRFLNKYVDKVPFVGNGTYLFVTTFSPPTRLLNLVDDLKNRIESLHGVKYVRVISPELANEEIGKNISKELKMSSVISLIAIFVVVLLSVRKIGCSLGVILSIVLALEMFNFSVSFLSRIINITPMTLTFGVSTILGLGIDYAFYIATVGKRRTVLKASALASLTFLAFGIIAKYSIPQLESIGYIMPITIMLTALIAVTLTSLVTPNCRIVESGKKSKIVELVMNTPRSTLIIVTIISLLGVYALLNIVPYVDIMSFLPSTSPTVKGISELEKMGVVGLIAPLTISFKTPEPVTASLTLSESLLKLKLASHVFSLTHPLGRFLGILNETVLLKIEGTRYFNPSNNVTTIKVLLSSNPLAIAGIKETEELSNYVKKVVNGKVEGLSKQYLSLSLKIKRTILTALLPLTIISTTVIISLMFKDLRGVFMGIASLAALLSSVLFAYLIFAAFKVEFLWITIPLLIAVIAGLGSDYAVFTISELREKEPREAFSVAGYLLVNFATTFAVAYYALLHSSILALKEIGFVLGTSSLFLALAMGYIVVPALQALAMRNAPEAEQ